jgi:hypothetical protein
MAVPFLRLYADEGPSVNVHKETKPAQTEKNRKAREKTPLRKGAPIFAS